MPAKKKIREYNVGSVAKFCCQIRCSRARPWPLHALEADLGGKHFYTGVLKIDPSVPSPVVAFSG